MQEYHKLKVMIQEFYTHKYSLESDLQTNIFDQTTREKIHTDKEQCIQSLLFIFSLTKQETKYPTIRYIGAELAQAISMLNKSKTISFDELSSLSDIIKRIDKEIVCIIEEDQKETRAINDFECMKVTERLRKNIGISTNSSFSSCKKRFLCTRRYSILSQDALDLIISEIDAVLSSSLFMSNDLQQSSYYRFPDFLIQLKKIIIGVIDDRSLPSKKIVSSSISFLDDVDVEIDEYDDEDKKDETSDHTLGENLHLRRLTADREKLLLYMNIPEEITEDNYTTIFEEYRGHFFLHEQKDHMRKILYTASAKYILYRSRTGESEWIGEAMIFLKQFLKTKGTREKCTKIELHKKKLENALKNKNDALGKQSIYFPKIIHLLKVFKKVFADTYFSQSPQKIREAFLEQYTSLVLNPVVKYDSELLSFSDRESMILERTHRKKELYEGIPSIIRKGSDALIERGVAQGFIFGEIDDLIRQLQKIYNENIT